MARIDTTKNDAGVDALLTIQDSPTLKTTLIYNIGYGVSQVQVSRSDRTNLALRNVIADVQPNGKVIITGDAIINDQLHLTKTPGVATIQVSNSGKAVSIRVVDEGEDLLFQSGVGEDGMFVPVKVALFDLNGAATTPIVTSVNPIV